MFNIAKQWLKAASILSWGENPMSFYLETNSGKHAAVILMGDFNAKLAREPDTYVGRWCIHTRANTAYWKTMICLLLSEQLSTPPANCGITMSTSSITQDEIDEAVFRLANGKVVGADGIHGEYLKACPSARARLFEIIIEFWRTRRYQMTGPWADLSCCTRKAAKTTTTGQYACSLMPTRSYP